MTPRTIVLVMGAAHLLWACAASGGVMPPADPDASTPPDGSGEPDPPTEPHRPSDPPDVSCTPGGPAGPATALGFDHFTSGRFGDARHMVREPVVTLGEPFRLVARFRYGLGSDDLEDEEVAAFVRLDPCEDWTELGSLRTDDEGMVSIDVEPELFAAEGAYEIQIVVLGDLSRARGYVHVVPWGQPAVVFDIDGTLTTSDSELFAELYDGEPAEMYDGGDDVVWLYAEAGYLIVYLTGRPHMLQDMSRVWLEERDFPVGPVITGDHLLEATGPLVVRHKREHLASLRGQGLDVVRAYGNATTDICAYAEANIDPAATYIIGPHAGEACEGYGPTMPVESYPTHMVTMEPPPAAWD